MRLNITFIFPESEGLTQERVLLLAKEREPTKKIYL